MNRRRVQYVHGSYAVLCCAMLCYAVPCRAVLYQTPRSRAEPRVSDFAYASLFIIIIIHHDCLVCLPLALYCIVLYCTVYRRRELFVRAAL